MGESVIAESNLQRGAHRLMSAVRAALKWTSWEADEFKWLLALQEGYFIHKAVPNKRNNSTNAQSARMKEVILSFLNKVVVYFYLEFQNPQFALTNITLQLVKLQPIRPATEYDVINHNESLLVCHV